MLHCGFDGSGLAPGTDRAVCSIRAAGGGARGLEVPVAVAGAWLVTPEYLQYVAAVAAERLAVEHRRLAALLAEVRLHKGRVAIRD